MSASQEAASPPARRVTPQNQQDSAHQDEPLGLYHPETPADGFSPQNYSQEAHPIERNGLEADGMEEGPRPHGQPAGSGEITDVRHPQDVLGDMSGGLPSGGSLSVPQGRGTQYYDVRAPTGQTIYFTNPGQASAYATSPVFNENTQPTPTKPAGFLGDLEQGAGSLYDDFTSGVKDVVTAAGVGGTEIGTAFTTGRFESINSATNQYLTRNVGLGTGADTAAFGSQIISYTTPGVAIVKGIGEYNASPEQRLFDIGVGVLGVAPIVGEAAGLTEAGSLGGKLFTTLGNPFIRTGLGAGISAAGSAASGGSITQDIEAGALGGGFSYFGGAILSRIGESAVAGRTSQILFEGDQGTGPTYMQRFSMAITGWTSLKAPPVVGVESTESGAAIQGTGVNVTSFPGSGSVYGTGRLSGSGFDFADFEGSSPVRGTGRFELEQPPPVPPASTSAMTEHITDMPYASNFDTQTDIKLGTAATNTDFSGSGNYREGESFFNNNGPSGASGTGGITGRGAGSNLSYEQQQLRYPPGTSFDTTQFRMLYEEGALSTPSFAFKTGFPTITPLVSSASTSSLTQQQGAKVNTGQTSVQSLSQGSLSDTLLSQQSVQAQSSVSVQSQQQQTQTQQQQITALSIANPSFLFGEPAEPGQKFGGAFPIGIFPFGSGNGRKAARKKNFAFGERLNPINTSFFGGFDFNTKANKPRTRKKKG